MSQISIVLVTYNRPYNLELAINDILNQTYQNFELIICDDFSSDLETIIVGERFQSKDDRIRYVRQPYNIQMPKNLNVGIEMAKFPYIAILHDSDRFAPNLLERWIDAINKKPTVAFVFNKLSGFDEKGLTHIDKSHFSEGVIKGEVLLKKTFRNKLFGSFVWGEALVRKRCLEEVGFLKEEYGFYADVELWLELLHNNDAYCCDEALISCPSKKMLPRLFDDSIMKVLFLLFNIHYKHRKKEYKHDINNLMKEFAIFYSQCFYYYCYQTLIIYKHYKFKDILRAGKITLDNFPPLIVLWCILLPLKPFFYFWGKLSKFR